MMRTARRSKYGIRKLMEVKYARRIDPETGNIIMPRRARNKGYKRDLRKRSKGLYRTGNEPSHFEYWDEEAYDWVEGSDEEPGCGSSLGIEFLCLQIAV